MAIEPMVTGLVFAGRADVKNMVSRSGDLSPLLKNILLGTVDIQAPPGEVAPPLPVDTRAELLQTHGWFCPLFQVGLSEAVQRATALTGKALLKPELDALVLFFHHLTTDSGMSQVRPPRLWVSLGPSTTLLTVFYLGLHKLCRPLLLRAARGVQCPRVWCSGTDVALEEGWSKALHRGWW